MLSVPGKALLFETIIPIETLGIHIGFYYVYLKMFSCNVEWENDNEWWERLKRMQS